VSDKITLTIDGLQITTTPGKSVLEAALDNGIYIPNLCYHPDLRPVGVCRLCVVEIEGRRTSVACKTPAEEGMVVQTETEPVRKLRKTAAKLLIANHHNDCNSCKKNTSCGLQRIADYVGITTEDLEQMRKPEESLEWDRSNPFFDRDLDKCIVCGICVRTCEEILGVNAINFVNRGFQTTIGTFGDRPLKESRCVSCGECVVRCPVGALVPKHMEKPAREVSTICTYCGCGCGMFLGVRGDRVVSARGDRDNPANKGNLCVKGRFGYDFVNSEERLKTPLIKKDGEFQKASWDDALDLVAKKLGEHKGDETVVLSSAKVTNEENYVVQKLTRAVVGTNNIDHCARL
jgi:formate dehydrogenase major subunit